MPNNQLTVAQVAQLVRAVAKSPVAAYHALKGEQRFTDEQQQKLVDGVARDALCAMWTLRDVPWLTSEQKGTLRRVS